MKNKWLFLCFFAFFIVVFLGGAPLASAQPVVLSVSPTQGQCNVPITDSGGNPTVTPVVVTFSDAMDMSSLISGFRMRPAVTGILTLDSTGTILTFTPDMPFESGKVYYVAILTTASSSAGTQITNPFISGFSADNCPYVVSTFPVNNSSKIGLNVQPSVTFSTAMNGNTINNTNFTLTAPGDGAVAGTAMYNSTTRTATFSPSGMLAVNTVYTAMIKAGVQDTSGTPMIMPYMWSFTSSEQGFNELNGSEIPVPNSNNVILNTTVSSKFTQPVNHSSITPASFSLIDSSGIAIDMGAPTFSNNDTQVTFGPLSLQAGTAYQVKITDVTSVTKPPMHLESPVQWSFTTVPPFDVVQSAEVPTPDSTGVSIYPAISVAFSQAVLESSITSTSFTLTDPAGTVVSLGTPVFNTNGTTVTFGPLVDALKSNTVYKVTLTTNISSTANPPAALPSVRQWSFTTGSGGVRPFNVDPTTEVPIPQSATVPMNTTVAVSFTQPVARNSIISSSFVLTNTTTGIAVSMGTPEFSAGDLTVTFGPLSLEANTNYAVTITTAVTNATNPPVALPAQVQWSFTTASAPPPSAAKSNGGVNCFIATAAYGSYLDPHVKALRNFRDKYLLTNPAGKAFVEFYYRHSPPIAVFIARHEYLRLATRIALTPIVYVVENPFSLAAVFAGTVFVFGRRRKRKGDLRQIS